MTSTDNKRLLLALDDIVAAVERFEMATTRATPRGKHSSSRHERVNRTVATAKWHIETARTEWLEMMQEGGRHADE